MTPVRVAVSRPAIKAYLTTLLFLFTSTVLISISTTAYFLFYYNYIPQIGLTQTIYLQYDANSHPHATIPIDPSALVSQQPYDISVTLHMPRTPANLAAGNFMLDLSLLPERSASSGPLAYLFNTTLDLTAAAPLARSRRSAIIPYSSYLTSLSHKLLHLPVHLLSLKDLDAAVITVPLFERLAFARGRPNIPTAAYLEVQSQIPPTGCPPSQQPVLGMHLLTNPTPTPISTLQIYSAQLDIHVRFTGLRYYVYNYRVLSFLIFSSLFYTMTISSMAVTWAFVTAALSARNPTSTLSTTRGGKIKSEDSATSDARSPNIKSEDGKGLGLNDIKSEDADSDVGADLDARALASLSSTEHTFPTLGRNAQPLRYTPSTTTNPSEDAERSSLVPRDDAIHDAEDEDDEDEEEARNQILTPLSAETHIKDEDEEDTFRGDSGIGTSMDSEARSSSGLVRRRSSRGARNGSGSGNTGR